jgi:hypothetical protein
VWLEKLVGGSRGFGLFAPSTGGLEFSPRSQHEFGETADA